MPNNVYIGSRYLPLFDGAWSPIKSYEALIIVEYGNNSYTSKRPVPVNTPPTTGDENDPYWGLSGNYNGQISNLQQQINTNASNITALAKKINRKFIFFGDSYAVAYQPGGDEVTPDITGYYDLAISALSLSPNDYIKVVYGRTGFMSAGTNGKTWLQDLNDLASDDSITDVYVMGGCNDIAYYNSGLNTAIATFISTAKTKFPNAKIKIGFCGRQSVNSVFSVVNMRNAINVYKDSAIANGAVYLVNSENILKGVNSCMASDHYHPNTVGENMLKNYLVNDILTGNGLVTQGAFTAFGVTYDKEATTGVPLNYFGYSQSEDDITIQLAANMSLTGNFTPRTTLSTNYYPLFTINGDALAGDQYGTLGCLVPIFFIADHHNYLGYGHFKIIDKVAYVSIVALDNNGSLFTPTTINAIGIDPFTFTVPKSQVC